MADHDHTPNPELEIQGADAAKRIPGLRNHLDGCPACREEHDSLLALVTAEHPAD
jgi:hypothetical protein